MKMVNGCGSRLLGGNIQQIGDISQKGYIPQTKQHQLFGEM